MPSLKSRLSMPSKPKNYAHLVVLTNDEYPVKITANDRRLFCIEADSSKKSDPAYWKRLGECFNDACGVQFSQLLMRGTSRTGTSEVCPIPNFGVSSRRQIFLPPLNSSLTCSQGSRKLQGRVMSSDSIRKSSGICSTCGSKGGRAS
jgi:hypothetical protein